MKLVLLFFLLATALCLQAADLSGNWPGIVETIRGVDTHNLTLRQSGNSITGVVSFSNRQWDIQAAKLEGQRLTFQITLSGANPWVLFYDLKVDGDEIAGKLTAKQGAFPGGKVSFKREK